MNHKAFAKFVRPETPTPGVITDRDLDIVAIQLVWDGLTTEVAERQNPLIAGDRLDGPLSRLKTWMEQNHAALIAAILFIIGAALLYKGIHGLQPVQ